MLELVPESDPLVVEARVADHDIDRVAVGEQRYSDTLGGHVGLRIEQL